MRGKGKVVRWLSLVLAVLFVCACAFAESGVEYDDEGGVWDWDKGTYTPAGGPAVPIVQDDEPASSSSGSGDTSISVRKNDDGSEERVRVRVGFSKGSIAEIEKMIGGKGQQDVAASTYFLTVILQDLKEESNTVQIGNTMVKRTNYTRKAVANVRDYNGNVIFRVFHIDKVNHNQTS